MTYLKSTEDAQATICTILIKLSSDVMIEFSIGVCMVRWFDYKFILMCLCCPTQLSIVSDVLCSWLSGNAEDIFQCSPSSIYSMAHHKSSHMCTTFQNCLGFHYRAIIFHLGWSIMKWNSLSRRAIYCSLLWLNVRKVTLKIENKMTGLPSRINCKWRSINYEINYHDMNYLLM